MSGDFKSDKTSEALLQKSLPFPQAAIILSASFTALRASAVLGFNNIKTIT
jgi:hypothetical protein